MRNKYCLKRAIDIIFSFCLIIILLPLFILISLMIILISGRPFLFIQKRPGKNEKLFNIYKFRTMINDARKKHLNGANPKDLILFGMLWVRKIHLDEIPQLFNILKGDMSFVGPRPLAIKDFKEHLKQDPEYHQVTKLKPGLTSMNQALGYLNDNTRQKIMKKIGLKKRSNIHEHNRLSEKYHQKLKEREFYYLEHNSFLLDLRIIWWTVLVEFQSAIRIFKSQSLYNKIF